LKKLFIYDESGQQFALFQDDLEMLRISLLKILKTQVVDYLAFANKNIAAFS